MPEQFTSSHKFRQRYWTRSFLGYPTILRAKPNSSHLAISKLESDGYIDRLITQNVDGLHQLAGTSNILELHGNLHEIQCLNCGHTKSRSEFQEILSELNPGWKRFLDNIDITESKVNPDGDYELDQERSFGEGSRSDMKKLSPRVNPDGDIDLPLDASYTTFRYPPCFQCLAGVYKPSVVFFGENIRPMVKHESLEMVTNCEFLMVIGSTLATYSAYRLVRSAKELGKKVVILNMGETRGDSLADVKIESECGKVLAGIVERLNNGGDGS
ncbi:2270_t:CDS:1 [Acaulospora colombiana]|uniref:2270_t:CDS:1 n=1 Tax=Acaulospora colombiana TaxID=27376 RepID=A0ACA9MAG9_9GLOM|nr:2270_t:CDS:1 [Acaulospora colombiana]